MRARHRHALAAILVAFALALPIGASAGLSAAPRTAAPAPALAQASEPQPTGVEPLPDITEHAAEAEEATWASTIARIFNFSVLVGVLVYFLRAPIRQYLSGRHGTIRQDLTDARATREAAEVRLAAVRARVAELPGELAALEMRGREELARERERMKAASAAEREKLLERTRREIDLQFRVARRDLVEHTADLAMTIARRRIADGMTPDDHERLIERYQAGVRP